MVHHTKIKSRTKRSGLDTLWAIAISMIPSPTLEHCRLSFNLLFIEILVCMGKNIKNTYMSRFDATQNRIMPKFLKVFMYHFPCLRPPSMANIVITRKFG
jgi:hypothetical protein